MGLNILIVDDSETVRAVIAKTLDIAGVDIGELFLAENGREALDLIGENWIDLILSDINMPVMSGIEMIEQMMEDEMMSTIPVIMVSTEGSKTRIEELKAKGVRAYIRKPFTPEGVLAMVNDIVGVTNEN